MGNAVIVAIDLGHVGSGLDNEGQVTDNSTCKRCKSPWPCNAVQVARQQHRRVHGVKEVKS